MMSEQMDDTNANSELSLKLAIKTPKEKKDISINASASVKQVGKFVILDWIVIVSLELVERYRRKWI